MDDRIKGTHLLLQGRRDPLAELCYVPLLLYLAGQIVNTHDHHLHMQAMTDVVSHLVHFHL